MLGLAYVVYVGLLSAYVRAEDTRFPCHELLVQVQVKRNGGPNQNTRCLIDFNYLDVTGYVSPNGGSEVWYGKLEVANFNLEVAVCRLQVTMLQRVANKTGLARESMTPYYVFHVGHGTWSAFMKAGRDVFILGDNGTAQYCRPPVDYERTVGLRRCRGCGEFLPTKAEANEMRHKWLEFCLQKEKGRPSTTKHIGFVCQNESEFMTTKRPPERMVKAGENVMPTRRVMESEPTEGRMNEGTVTRRNRRKGDDEIDGKEQREASGGGAMGRSSEANQVVTPVVVTVGIVGAIVGCLILWRSRGNGAWRRVREPGATY